MKALKDLTRFILIWFLSFFISNGVKASPKKNINQRVNSVREGMNDKKKQADGSKMPAAFSNEGLDKWYNWGDWNNWRNWDNWNNWSNWGNWGNWGNWYNY